MANKLNSDQERYLNYMRARQNVSNLIGRIGKYRQDSYDEQVRDYERARQSAIRESMKNEQDDIRTEKKYRRYLDEKDKYDKAVQQETMRDVRGDDVRQEKQYKRYLDRLEEQRKQLDKMRQFDVSGNDVRQEKQYKRYLDALENQKKLQAKANSYAVSGDDVRDEKKFSRYLDRLAEQKKQAEKALKYSTSGDDVRDEKKYSHYMDQVNNPAPRKNTNNVFQGDMDYSTWMGEKSEGVRKALQVGNAQRATQQWWADREAGKLGANGDIAGMNQAQRDAYRKQLEEEKEKASASVDAHGRAGGVNFNGILGLYNNPEIGKYQEILDGDYSEEEKQNAEERLYMLRNGERDEYGRSATERANEALWRLENEYDPDDMTEQTRDQRRRMVYDMMNGDGAYDGLEAEEREKVNIAIDQATGNVLAGQSDATLLENEKSNVRTINNLLAQLDYQDRLEQRYNELMSGEITGDGTWDPAYSVKTEEINDAWDTMKVGSNVDDVYNLLNPETATWTTDITDTGVGAALLMNDEMKQKFISLYKDGKKDQAWAFFEGVLPYLNQAYHYFEKTKQEEEASRNPILSTLGTMGAHLMQPAEFLANLPAQIKALINGEQSGVTDPYSSNYALARYKNTVRNKIANNIGELGWMYSGIMSGVDSGLNIAIGRGLGLKEEAMEYGVLALFFTQSFDTSLQNAMAEGNGNFAYDVAEAFIDSAIDTATEIWSVEKWLADPTNIMRYLIKVGVSEASEEAVGAMAEPYIKQILGHRHQYNARADEIWAQGGYRDNAGNFIKVQDWDDAKRQALREWNHDIRMAAQQALLSVGPAAINGTVQISRNNRNIGRAIQNQQYEDGTTGLDTVLEAAKGLDTTTKSFQEAQKIQQRLENGGKAGNFATGQLASDLMRESQEQAEMKAQDALRNEVRKELAGKEIRGSSAEEMTDLIMKAIDAGGIDNLSKKEREKIHDSSYGYNTYLKFVYASEQSSRAAAAQTEATKAERKAMQSISDALTQKKTQTVADDFVGKQLASQDDIDRAEGKRTQRPDEVIVQNKFGTLEGMELDEKSGEWKYRVKVDGRTEKLDASELKATNFSTAALVRQQLDNPAVYSGDYVNHLMKQINTQQNTKIGNYLRDAENVRWAAFFGEDIPATGLSEEEAKEIYRISQADLRSEWMKDQASRQENYLGKGNGRASFAGVEFGSEEWTKKLDDSGLTEDEKKTVNGLAGLAVSSGIQFNFVDQINNNDYIHGSEAQSGITIAIRSFDSERAKNAGQKHEMIVTVGHELTHWLRRNNAAGYIELQNYVVNTMKDRGVNIHARAQEMMDNRRKAGDNLTMSGAIEEMVANACDQVMASQEAADYLEKNNPGLYEKIRSYVKDLVQRIKTMFAEKKGWESASRDAVYNMGLVGEQVNELNRIWWGKFDEVLSGQVRELQAPAEGQTEKTAASMTENELEERYSRAEEDYNFDPDFVKNIRLFKNNQTEFKKQNGDSEIVVGNTFKILQDIGIDNKPLVIDQKHLTMAFDNTTEKNHKMTPDEMIEIIKKANHPIAIIKSRSIGQENNSVVMLIDHEINGHTTMIPVRVSTEGYNNQLVFDANKIASVHSRHNLRNLLIDAVNTELEGKKPGIYYVNKNKTDFLRREGVQFPSSAKNNGLIHNINENPDFVKQTANHPQETKAVMDKMNFSMAEPVEETRDLIAVHNLGADQLMKVIGLGGFAMPSIAIVRNNYAHNRYGDISVLFYKDTIDPKRSTKNKVYGGDAWTPTYPSVEYKLSEKKMNAILKKVDALIPQGMKSSNVELYVDNLQKSVNSNRGDIVKAVKNITNLKLAYAADRGINIEYPMREKSLGGGKLDNQEIVAVVNALGEETVREAYENGYEWHKEHPEVTEKIIQTANELKLQELRERVQDEEKAQKMFNILKYTDEKWGYGTTDQVLGAAYRYLNRGIEQEIDEYALRDRLNEAIDEEDYEKWLAEEFDGAIEKKGLRNNKDYYTNQGNPRSWEQLHDEETLENVVNIMRQQTSKGEAAFFNQSSLLAIGTKDFRSVNDIRKDKSRLQHISDEEMSAAKTGIIERVGEIQDQLAGQSDERNPFIARDRALGAIVDAVRSKKTAAGIQSVLKEWGYTVPIETGNEILNIMKEVAELPTEYFEAKPQRAVGLNEIAKVVLPQDTDRKLIDALEKNGVTYEFYDGTDEDRLAKMNDDSIMFSMAEDDAADVGVWMMGLTESSVHTEGERALIREYRGLKTSLDLCRKRQEDYTSQIRKLQAKSQLTAEERDTLIILQNKLQVQQDKQARLEQELYDVTRSEGYAGMMYRNSKVFDDYINGKNQAQVEAAVDRMMAESDQMVKNIEKRAKKLRQMREDMALDTIRKEMRKRGLRENAKALKEQYWTTMTQNELEGRLAEIILRAVNGEQDIKTWVDSLAMDIISSPINQNEEYARDALDKLRGRTIVINKEQQAELKGAKGWGLKALRDAMRGSGIKFEFGDVSTLEQDWQDLEQENTGLQGKMSGGGQSIIDFVDYVQDLLEGLKGDPKDFNFSQDELSFVIATCAQTMLSEESGGMSLAALRDRISKAAGEIGAVADAVDKMLESAKAIKGSAMKASNAAGGLRGDAVAAIDYYNLIAKQAAEVERNRVKRTVIEELRSENTKKLIEQQQKYQEMMKKDKRARELQHDNEQLRKVITTDVKRLKDRLIAETDQKNVQEEAKPLARQLVSMLVDHDMAGFRHVLFSDKKTLTDVQQRLAKMEAANGSFDMDADLDFLVIKAPNAEDNDYSLKDKVLEDLMHIEQGLLEYRNAEGKGNVSLADRKAALEKVQEAVSEIYDVIRARETAFIMGQKRNVLELATQMERDMAESRFRGERKGRGSQVKDLFWNDVGYGNLTPEYFIKNLRNRTLSVIYEGMHEAEKRSGLEARDAKARITQIAQATGYATWDGQEKKTVTLTNGKRIEISVEQLMALYATWNREKNALRPEETSHLLKGGFVLTENDTREGKARRERSSLRPIRVNEDDLNSIGSYLTEQQKQYADAIVEYMSTDLAQIGNEASLRTYGIRKFTETYYFPTKSWDGVLNQNSASGISNQNENRAMRQSFTKRIQAGARNALEIGDFTPTAMKHITGMITFNTVGPAVENLNKVLNQQLDYYEDEEMDPDEAYKRNVRTAFEENYGKMAYNYLKQFMKDVNGGVARRNETIMREKLLSIFKKNAVAGSLSVAAQQPLSYIRAAMLISPKYLAQAISPQYWRGSYEEMMSHSGVAVIKEMGKFDMNFGQSMTDYITPDGMKTTKDRIKAAGEVATALPGKMDDMTWTRMWSACKLEQAALHPEMDVKSEEFLDMVADRFEELMRRTQVYDSVMVKSQNMRSDNYLNKIRTSFMAEPTLSLNVLADAWMNMKEKGGKANAAKALATFILSAAAQAGAKAFFGTGRSPDKKKNQEENFLNKFLQSLLGEINPFGLIPGYSQITEAFINGELSDDAMGMIGKAKDAMQRIVALASGDIGKKGLYRDMEDSVGQLVQIATDVPLKNFMRDFRAMVNWFSGGTATGLTGDSYAARKTSTAVLKQQSLESLMTKELGGLLNSMLGDAGYKTDNTSYVKRIYEAQKKGDDKTAAEIREYMETVKLNGKDPGKWIDSQLNAMLKEDDSLSTEEKMESLGENGYGSMGKYINDQYRAGEIDRKTAEEYYRKENPTATDKDVAKFLDKTDWEKDGKPLAEGQKNYTNYTPLYVAMQDNKVEDIRDAVEHMKEIGYTEKDIKKEVSSSDGVIRNQYMAADTDGRRRIRDAMEKAYKALGYTAEDADKTISKWK